MSLPDLRRLVRSIPVAVLLVVSCFVGASVLGTSLASATSPTTVCTGVTCTVTFGFSGAEQIWDVPSGVNDITVDVYGAAGGASGGASFAHAVGGVGAHVHATLAVPWSNALTGTPQATFKVVVGGQGGTDGSEAGGFDGGGGTGTTGNAFGVSGGGGGASYVQCDEYGNLAVELVAGGGGGGGAYGGGTGPSGAGGVAGGAGGPSGGSGSPGASVPGEATGGEQGGQGTDTAGGLGGQGVTAAETGAQGSSLFPGDSVTGGGGAGGTGGAPVGGDGGGGGGGYYGGGGGAGGGSFIDDPSVGAGGGGGGGGSDFVVPDASNVSVTDGVNAGNGEVVISYTTPTTVTTSTTLTSTTVPTTTTTVPQLAFTGASRLSGLAVLGVVSLALGVLTLGISRRGRRSEGT